MTALRREHYALVIEAERQLPDHARAAFRKDVADILRGRLQPGAADVAVAVTAALDMAARRGAAA